MRIYLECRFSYFHIMTESFLGLYLFLKNRNLLDSDCEIWIKDRYKQYVPMLKYFTNIPIKASADIPPNCQKFNLDFRYTLEKYMDLIPLRDYFESKLQIENVEPSVITLVSRRSKRIIKNHYELKEKLRQFNLPIVDIKLEDLNFEEQIKLMKRTKVLVAAHGAGLTNLMFMKKDSIVIENTPKFLPWWHFETMSKVFDLFYFNNDCEVISRRSDLPLLSPYPCTRMLFVNVLIGDSKLYNACKNPDFVITPVNTILEQIALGLDGKRWKEV